MQIEKLSCRLGKQETSGQNLKSAIRNMFGTDGTDLAALST